VISVVTVFNYFLRAGHFPQAGFYFFDRFFRTMAKSHRPFNWEAAIGRYGLEDAELLSLRGCSKALFHKEAGIKTASRNA